LVAAGRSVEDIVRGDSRDFDAILNDQYNAAAYDDDDHISVDETVVTG
jgi:hypothetical protein